MRKNNEQGNYRGIPGSKTNSLPLFSNYYISKSVKGLLVFKILDLKKGSNEQYLIYFSLLFIAGKIVKYLFFFSVTKGAFSIKIADEA